MIRSVGGISKVITSTISFLYKKLSFISVKTIAFVSCEKQRMTIGCDRLGTHHIVIIEGLERNSWTKWFSKSFMDTTMPSIVCRVCPVKIFTLYRDIFEISATDRLSYIIQDSICQEWSTW